MNIYWRIFFLWGLLFSPFVGVPSLFAQADTDTLSESLIIVDQSNNLEHFNQPGKQFQRLSGNVILHQDSVYMFCDTADLWDNNARIFGHVSIQQGDSLTIYADSVIYDGTLRKAQLFGEVILKHGLQELHTHRLDYDLVSKKAYYLDGAILKDGDSKLYSKVGHFYVKENTVFFKDSVTIDNDKFHLQTDTLAFNTTTRRARFLAPTLIEQGQSLIYCEAGYYDLQTGEAEFRKHAQYKKGGQEAQADTMHYDRTRKITTLTGKAKMKDGNRRAQADKIIYQDDSDMTILDGHAQIQDSTQTVKGARLEYDGQTKNFKSFGRAFVSNPPYLLQAASLDYDKKRGVGVAIGDVVWQDTSRQMMIQCDTAEYRKSDDYLKAYGGRPLVINVLEGDSMYMRCDTLLVLRELVGQDSVSMDSVQVNRVRGMDLDTIRVMHAFRNVRMYKSDMQSVCDSLTYSSADSMFRFFYNPLVWADTTQFSADTIRMELKAKKLHRIDLMKNAFLINSEDMVLFNQIAGKEIHAHFRENEIRTVRVKGNAKSVYYALDEGKGYIGINKVEASSMLIFFGHNQVERIRYYDSPKGEMQPIQSVNPKDYELKGFKWEVESRPQSKDDL